MTVSMCRVKCIQLESSHGFVTVPRHGAISISFVVLSKETCPCSSFHPHSCVLQQAEQQAKDVLPDLPSLPATVRHGGISGRGATTPTASLPCLSELAQMSRAAGRAPPPLAYSKSSALPTPLQEKSYHMYKTKSFSCCNLFFPAPKAFVSKQDTSL